MSPLAMLAVLVQMGICTPPIPLEGPDGKRIMAIVCPLPQPAAEPGEKEEES